MIVAVNNVDENLIIPFEEEGYGIKINLKSIGSFIARAVPAAIVGGLIGGPVGLVAGAATGFIGGSPKKIGKRLLFGLGAGIAVAGGGFLLSEIAGSQYTSMTQGPVTKTLLSYLNKQPATGSITGKVTAQTTGESVTKVGKTATKVVTQAATQTTKTAAESGVRLSWKTLPETVKKAIHKTVVKGASTGAEIATRMAINSMLAQQLAEQGYSEEEVQRIASNAQIQSFYQNLIASGYTPEQAVQILSQQVPIGQPASGGFIEFVKKNYMYLLPIGIGVVALLFLTSSEGEKKILVVPTFREKE